MRDLVLKGLSRHYLKQNSICTFNQRLARDLFGWLKGQHPLFRAVCAQYSKRTLRVELGRIFSLAISFGKTLLCRAGSLFVPIRQHLCWTILPPLLPLRYQCLLFCVIIPNPIGKFTRAGAWRRAYFSFAWGRVIALCALRIFQLTLCFCVRSLSSF